MARNGWREGGAMDQLYCITNKSLQKKYHFQVPFEFHSFDNKTKRKKKIARKFSVEFNELYL